MLVKNLDWKCSLVGRCKVVENGIEVFCPEFKYFLSKRIYRPVLRATVILDEYILLEIQVEDAFADKDFGEDFHHFCVVLDDSEKRYLQTLMEE